MSESTRKETIYASVFPHIVKCKEVVTVHTVRQTERSVLTNTLESF